MSRIGHKGKSTNTLYSASRELRSPIPSQKILSSPILSSHCCHLEKRPHCKSKARCSTTAIRTPSTGNVAFKERKKFKKSHVISTKHGHAFDCECGPDLYTTVLGPTADEAILSGIKTFLNIFRKYFVCEKEEPPDHHSSDEEILTRKSRSKSRVSKIDSTSSAPEVITEVLESVGFPPEMASAMMQTSFAELEHKKPSLASKILQTSAVEVVSKILHTLGLSPEMVSQVLQTSFEHIQEAVRKASVISAFAQTSKEDNLSDRTIEPEASTLLHTKPTHGDLTSPEEFAGDARSKSGSIFYEKSKSDSIAYEKSKNDSIAYEKSKNDSLAYEKSRNDSLAYDKSKNDSLAYEKSKNDSLAYHKSKNDSFAYEKFKNDSLAHHQSNNDSLPYQKSRDDSIAYQKSKSDSISYQKSKSDSISCQKSQSDSISYDQSKSDSISKQSAEESDDCSCDAPPETPRIKQKMCVCCKCVIDERPECEDLVGTCSMSIGSPGSAALEESKERVIQCEPLKIVRFCKCVDHTSRRSQNGSKSRRRCICHSVPRRSKHTCAKADTCCITEPSCCCD